MTSKCEGDTPSTEWICGHLPIYIFVSIHDFLKLSLPLWRRPPTKLAPTRRASSVPLDFDPRPPESLSLRRGVTTASVHDDDERRAFARGGG